MRPVCSQFGVVDRPEQRHAVVEPFADEPRRAGPLLAVAGDHGLDAAPSAVASARISRSARLSGVSRDTMKMKSP